MGKVYKPLFQRAPAAATLTDAYTLAAGTSAVVSSLTACNRGASSDTIRISVAVAGEADAAKQYIYYDLPVIAKDTFKSIAITLGATDVVRVWSNSGNTVFSAFGCEVS